jgi:hypothetical protein
LPVEAVLYEPAGEYMDPAHEADAEILEDAEEYDMESEDMNEEDFRVLHPPGEGLNTCTIPLHQILPSSIRHLRIVDDWDIWSDAPV